MLTSVMKKRVLLAMTAMCLVAGAYLLLSSGDRPAPKPRSSEAAEAVRQFVTLPTSQPTQMVGDGELPFSPGDRIEMQIYDDVTGRLRYRFEAEAWNKLTDVDYHITDLLIQIYMARGEVTSIRADEADVVLTRKAKGRIEAQRGTLYGNVHVTIDRTTSKWRKENPDRAAPDSHADELIHIDMEQARFDMDRAELVSDGSVVVESTEARIENVSGLIVQWDQIDNRLDLLRFAQGGRMLLRRGVDAVTFDLPGAERKRRRAGGARTPADAGGAGPSDAPRLPRARANQPFRIQAPRADEAAAELLLEGGPIAANTGKSISAGEPPRQPNALRTPEALAADRAAMQAEATSGLTVERDDPATDLFAESPERPVHTYRAVFTNEVRAEQIEGGRTVGTLDADRLEVLFDFGSAQRDLLGGGSSTSTTRPGAAPMQAASRPAAAPDSQETESVDGGAQLVLTWDGPLELRPLARSAEQETGKRFDLIATGKRVMVHSEQGDAVCRQLVFRHERRQVWLSGGEGAAVEMSIDASRRLVGAEVFFDQARSLARVDGPGYLIDTGERKPEIEDRNGLGATGGLSARASTGSPDAASGPAAHSAAEADEKRTPVPTEIRWTQGVDLELARRVVHRLDPRTGAVETKEKEYLRRAWFHGDVGFQRGEETMRAEEVAATLMPPRNEDSVAEQIEHLNLVGDVEIANRDDHISAETLDVEMIPGADGQSVPRRAHGVGHVIARRDQREIRADVMDVELNQYPGPVISESEGRPAVHGKRRVGIDRLVATGHVEVRDPKNNLKVSRAQSLNTELRNGNELCRVTIVSPEPDVHARARFQDFAIHGHRILIDIDRQTVSVPGPGRAWMARAQDERQAMPRPTPVENALVGQAWVTLRRQLGVDVPLSALEGELLGQVWALARDKLGGADRALPVMTTWTDHLDMPLERNYGVFVGNVCSRYEGLELKCHKMTIRFTREPPQSSDQPARARPESEIVVRTDPRRATSVIAEGNAQAVNSDSVRTPAGFSRLQSRIYIEGRQIVADLDREELYVPGEGLLFIEDYQFDDPRVADRTAGRTKPGPMMSSVRGEGPSQTLIEWKNSMLFFVGRGLVNFDKDVYMSHFSGQKMFLRNELAESMRLDPETFKRLKAGRTASMTCGNLLVEFLIDRSAGANADAREALIRATDLRRLIAKGAVHLQEGSKSLMGDYLHYLLDTHEVRLQGSPRVDARIVDEDPDGRMSMWRGPLVVWNRKTNEVEAVHANIQTSRR